MIPILALLLGTWFVIVVVQRRRGRAEGAVTRGVDYLWQRAPLQVVVLVGTWVFGIQRR